MKNAYLEPQTWDERVADYESTAEPFTRQYAERALDLVNLTNGERLLDVAAGTGALALSAAERGAQVLAVGFAPAMIARLSVRLRALGSGHDARVMDGQKLDIADRSFDVTASMFGVMLFADYQTGLKEMARVTRHGGRGIVASWSRPEGAGPILVFHDVYERLFPDGPGAVMPSGLVAMSNLDQLRLAMNQAGFQKVSVETAHFAFKLPAPAWLSERADFLFGQVPRWIELSERDRSRMRAALAARAEAEIPSAAHIAMGWR